MDSNLTNNPQNPDGHRIDQNTCHHVRISRPDEFSQMLVKIPIFVCRSLVTGKTLSSAILALCFSVDFQEVPRARFVIS